MTGARMRTEADRKMQEENTERVENRGEGGALSESETAAKMGCNRRRETAGGKKRGVKL